MTKIVFIKVLIAVFVVSTIFTSCNSYENKYFYNTQDIDYLEISDISKAIEDKELETAFEKALQDLNVDKENFVCPQEIANFDEYEEILYFANGLNNKLKVKDFNIPYVCSKTHNDKAIIDFYVNFVPGNTFTKEDAENHYLSKLYLEKNNDGIWKIADIFIPA